MNDNDILYALLNRLRAANHVEQSVKDCYEYLVKEFPEHGFEQLFSLDSLCERREEDFRMLRKLGYIETAIKYHGTGGHFYHIDLRGTEFLKYQMVENETKFETFPTGAVRDSSDGKPRFDLISPFALEKLADRLTLGAKKYGERNWEAGLGQSRNLQSLLRHLSKYQQGIDDGEDHLVAIFCNAMFLLHEREMVRRGVLPEVTVYFLIRPFLAQAVWRC